MTSSYQEQTDSSCPLVVPQSDTLAGLDLHGHISAPQLAALGLAGLPKTRDGIDRLGKRSGWRFIDRVGRGGGRLYAIADLPEAARLDLLARRLEWVDAQTRSRGRPAGQTYFTRNPDAADAVIAMLAERRQSAASVHAKLKAHFPELRPPSLRAVQRFVARIEHERQAELASFRDPDTYKGRYRLALGNASASVTYANELWELDTTPADVMTLGGRKSILGLIDRYSRRANFMVCDSESAQSVRNLLIDTITKWGVLPKTVMTDQGSGFINGSIVSALEALGIEHYPCPPGSPEKKPHIERLFGTFTRERAALLPGFAGHNVADAQRIRAKARKDSGRAVIEAQLTPEHLQMVLSNWLDGVYHVREHGTTRMPPMARWCGCRHPRTVAPPEAVLRVALTALVGERKVGKRGIVWRNGRYWSHALVPWIGREVMVRRNEDDLGTLYIFAPDGSFIDVAADHERLGISQEQVAIAARRQQDAYLKDARADIRAKQRRFNPVAMVASLLREDAESAAKVSYLPIAGQQRSTVTLDSLTEATTSHLLPSASAPAPAEPKSDVVVPLRRSPEQKMRDADAIIARAEAGETVDADELRRAQLYRTTSEYRAQAALHAT